MKREFAAPATILLLPRGWGCPAAVPSVSWLPFPALPEHGKPPHPFDECGASGTLSVFSELASTRCVGPALRLRACSLRVPSRRRSDSSGGLPMLLSYGRPIRPGSVLQWHDTPSAWGDHRIAIAASTRASHGRVCLSRRCLLVFSKLNPLGAQTLVFEMEGRIR